MKILFSPQRNEEKIEYEFNGEIIKVTYKGKTDIFDFSNLSDGMLENIETMLQINPFISAEKVNGELSIVLLRFYGKNASYEERFPEWEVV